MELYELSYEIYVMVEFKIDKLKIGSWENKKELINLRGVIICRFMDIILYFIENLYVKLKVSVGV